MPTLLGRDASSAQHSPENHGHQDTRTSRMPDLSMHVRGSSNDSNPEEGAHEEETITLANANHDDLFRSDFEVGEIQICPHRTIRSCTSGIFLQAVGAHQSLKAYMHCINAFSALNNY